MGDKQERNSGPSQAYNRARLADALPLPEEASSPDPSLTGPVGRRYESIRELEEDLLSSGPNSELYNWLINISEDDDESVAEAVTKFFQGSPQALCFLYDRLVDKGMASPIDKEIVERVMENNPEMGNEKKIAGLFMPPPEASLHTMEKVASRISEPYLMYGANDNKFCPKTRNLVSTYICRFHCLDGLAVDDAQILCGEAIWRQAVMDKFSRDFKDKDGKWKGGYLRKRFIIQNDDVARPYQLKPGHRCAPIHEDAWSTEKRLQEMRRTESSKRGYPPTPGDPKDAYNFDPYKQAGDTDSKEISEKKRDPIARNSSAKPFNLKKAGYEGDHSIVDEVTVTKECKKCRWSNEMTATKCARCGHNEFNDKTQVEQEIAAGATSSPEFMPEIHAANGVFMARKNGNFSFGDTENQAMSRAAATTIDEESAALLEMRRQDEMQGTTEQVPNTTGEEQGPEVEEEPIPEGEAPQQEGEPLPYLPAGPDETGGPDSEQVESHEAAREAEEAGPDEYFKAQDFTPEDALEEGEMLGLGDDEPKSSQVPGTALRSN